MSAIRKVKANIDPTLLDEVARKMGFNTRRNSQPNNYYGKFNEVCDIVIEPKGHRYEIGFHKNAQGEMEALYDNHNGLADKTLNEIMPSYYSQLVERRARQRGFRVTHTTETADQIIMVLKR